eukprot:TRINITY_DN709_c0_g1_i3.p1 TRINITY_DN709_c0_g1~~TRINITY_DN709_c0_g1_i3.p1  ORF type:complete len:231 (+),score=71.99 TRINITY_DN709_c0_g1_i3:134-826(+)
MKFLELPTLVELNDYLHEICSGDFILSGRVEAYSCKRAGSDKKLYKTLSAQYERQEEISKSPPNGSPTRSPKSPALSSSPFGPLSLSSSRNTIINLIATLNASFADYDFSEARPEHFVKAETHQMAMNAIDSTLVTVIPDYYDALRVRLWTLIDREVQLAHADIYSYIPTLDNDPFAEEGNIWSFNYFFYNKPLKRIIFLTCRCQRKTSVDVDVDAEDEKLQFETDDDMF